MTRGTKPMSVCSTVFCLLWILIPVTLHIDLEGVDSFIGYVAGRVIFPVGISYMLPDMRKAVSLEGTAYVKGVM